MFDFFLLSHVTIFLFLASSKICCGLLHNLELIELNSCLEGVALSTRKLASFFEVDPNFSF